MDQEIQYLTVTAINRYLKARFERDKYLRKIYIKGEISNLKKHYTGHYYFTLKDENSRINGIMYSSYVRNLTFELEEGMQVLITGSITVYENGGTYSLQAYSIEIDGIGNLYLKVEQLKKKLYEEGLFDPKHKKTISRYPRNIGVLAAKGSAALEDIINTINRRYPIAVLHIYSIPVQGNGAYKQIVSALQKADKDSLDVLLLARGGGSLEDLMNFNEEELIRCIYSLHTPIITGVGHEIDYTLVDYVSDLRAPTPTGAAMLCSVDLADLTQTLMDRETYLKEIINNKMKNYQDRLKRYASNTKLLENQLLIAKSKVNTLNGKVKLLSSTMILQKKNEINADKEYIIRLLLDQLKYKNIQLNKLIDELNILSPLNTLKRGYSIVSSDHVIESIRDLKENDQISIQMHDGKVHAKITEVHYE